MPLSLQFRWFLCTRFMLEDNFPHLYEHRKIISDFIFLQKTPSWKMWQLYCLFLVYILVSKERSRKCPTFFPSLQRSKSLLFEIQLYILNISFIQVISYKIGQSKKRSSQGICRFYLQKLKTRGRNILSFIGITILNRKKVWHYYQTRYVYSL